MFPDKMRRADMDRSSRFAGQGGRWRFSMEKQTPALLFKGSVLLPWELSPKFYVSIRLSGFR